MKQIYNFETRSPIGSLVQEESKSHMGRPGNCLQSGKLLVPGTFKSQPTAKCRISHVRMLQYFTREDVKTSLNFVTCFENFLPRPRQSFNQLMPKRESRVMWEGYFFNNHGNLNHLFQGVDVLSLNDKWNGLGWVDASDDSKIVFAEVEAPPAKSDSNRLTKQKWSIGKVEVPPLASKAFVCLDAGGLQVALKCGIPISVIEINNDHCIHGRERCKIALRDLITARPLDLVS